MRDLHFLLIPVPKVYAHSSIAHSLWHLVRDLTFQANLRTGGGAEEAPPPRPQHTVWAVKTQHFQTEVWMVGREAEAPPSATPMYIGV